MFLSFVSDAVLIEGSYYGWDVDHGREVILKLLELEADPSVSANDHLKLFKALQKLQPEGWPEWLDDAFPEYDISVRRPTALNRLLALEWDNESRAKIKEHVCCSLDAVTDPDKSLPIGFPRLECLAARKIS